MIYNINIYNNIYCIYYSITTVARTVTRMVK